MEKAQDESGVMFKDYAEDRKKEALELPLPKPSDGGTLGT